MKIIELKAENIKRLKAVEIKPDGNVVMITGKNGVGKSSVLDSIEMALSNKPVAKPIRDGEEKAKTEVHLEDYVISRTYTAKGNYLKVESKEGMTSNSPQAFLNRIVGKISFDPLQFARLSETPDGRRQQRKIIVQLDGKLDFTKLDEMKALMFSNRKAVNSRMRDLQGMVKTDIFKNVPDKETDIKSLSADIKTIEEKKMLYEQALYKKERTKGKLDLAKEELAEAQQSVKNCKEAIEGIQYALKKIEVPTKPNEKQYDILKKKANDALYTNSKVREKKEMVQLGKELETKKKETDKMTKRIEEVEKEKVELLKNAKLPIKGISLNDDGITYKNIPFDQLADSEKLKISFSIAMALNPQLKVVFIRDGSLLDSKNLAIIKALTRDRDFQCWIEKVDESGKIGFVIEDGEVIT